MTKPSLAYTLNKAGWATATFDNGESFSITVSYLHDSLRDLAKSVLDIESGTNSAVLFMDEPGEMRLDLEPSDDTVIYSLKWFDDWASWDIGTADDFKLMTEGTMSLQHYRHLVTAVLSTIYNDVGIARYKALWIEHDFPLDVFEELIGAQ